LSVDLTTEHSNHVAGYNSFLKDIPKTFTQLHPILSVLYKNIFN